VGVAANNNDGSATLVIRRQSSSGTAEARYTIYPDRSEIEAELEMRPTRASSFNWHMHMRASVWVVPNPGEMALYDLACVNGTVLRAQSTPQTRPSAPGVDYIEATAQTHGFAGIASTPRGNSMGLVLSESPVPVNLRADVFMGSQYGGWSFGRGFHVSGGGLAGGQTHIVRAILHGDSAVDFRELSRKAQVFRR
jgi:hypothetical protein